MLTAGEKNIGERSEQVRIAKANNSAHPLWGPVSRCRSLHGLEKSSRGEEIRLTLTNIAMGLQGGVMALFGLDWLASLLFLGSEVELLCQTCYDINSVVIIIRNKSCGDLR